MAGFLLFAGLLGFYLATAYPTLSPYRDSGDLAAAALTLGVAHPPGYPLYALASKAWLTVFTLGNAAYRLHVFSALLGALACVLLRRAFERNGARDAGAAGAAAALLLGLAPAFRHLSVVSEMYSLNACFAAGLLLLLSREEGAAARELCAAALLLGLGLGGHQTLLAAGPLLLLAGWGRLRSSKALWGLCALFLLAGLLVYVYLPWRSSLGPALDWGEPRAPRAFLRMLTRADYGGVRLHPERAAGLFLASGWLDGLKLSLDVFSRELGFSGALLLLLGLWGGRGALRSGALAGFLLSGPLFLVWANLDPAKPETYAILEPHLVLPLVFAATLAGLGAQTLLRRLERPAAKAAAALALAALWPWPSTGLPVSHRADFSAWDYGSALLASLEPGSLLVDPDDPTAFTLNYLLHAHARRPDVVPFLYFRTRWGYEQLRRRHPELLPPREIRSGQELLATVVSKAFEDRRPVAVDLPQKTPRGTSAFPVGLAYRLFTAPPSAPEARVLLAESLARREVLRLPPPPERADFFTRHTLAYWPSALNNLGVEAQRLGQHAEAVRIYRLALSAGPWLSESWNNWGNAALAQGDARAAEGCYLASLRERPSPQVVYNLGRAYFLAGRFADAESRFRQAIAEGGLVDAHNDLGLVLLRAGRTEEALGEWTGILARRPDYAVAYYNLALAYERMGRRGDALKALAAYRGLASDPAARLEADRWMEKLKK